MAGNYDENLAYGEDYSASRGSGQQSGDRGILGDIGKKLKSKYDQYQSQSQSQGQGQGQQHGGYGTGGYQYGSQPGTTPAGPQYGSQPPTSEGSQYAPTQHYQSSSYVPDGQGSQQPGYVGLSLTVSFGSALDLPLTIIGTTSHDRKPGILGEKARLGLESLWRFDGNLSEHWL
jgi:hypothetical protein